MNKIGLLDFWYYDDQEFYFLDGRMLLRGSNGSGKSVTMQSFIPLLLDGNMRPERLDPFGSRARKMENYLLEDGDERDERTGYLYMEFKRKDVENFLTIGIGLRARRGKKLDPNKEAMIHSVGLMVLMGFMLFVTYKDILKLF